MCILCSLQLILCSLQSILIFGDGVFLQSQLFLEHGQLGRKSAYAVVHVLDADSSQLELTFCQRDLLTESSNSRLALLNGLSGSIPIGLSQRQRLIALADFRLCSLYGSTGAIEVDVCL